MTDATGKNHKLYLMHNPWGSFEITYGPLKHWSPTDPNWTDALVAQVPFGIDPRK